MEIVIPCLKKHCRSALLDALWKIKHDEAPFRVPFHKTKRGLMPNKFLHAGALLHTSALFTIFAPAC